MSERDKMLSGKHYRGSDAELVAARIRARSLTQRLDTIDPADKDAADALIRDLLGKAGLDTTVVPPFRCDYGWNIAIGSRVFINTGCVFLDAAPITIGDDVQLGPQVLLMTSDHPRDGEERASGLESAHPITIGARSWLGGGVVVLPGIEIGSEVIIGAGSVVTRSLTSGVTAAGNPCRVIPAAQPKGR